MGNIGVDGENNIKMDLKDVRGVLGSGLNCLRIQSNNKSSMNISPSGCLRA